MTTMFNNYVNVARYMINNNFPMKYNSSVISLNDFFISSDRPVNTVFGTKMKMYFWDTAAIVIYFVM